MKEQNQNQKPGFRLNKIVFVVLNIPDNYNKQKTANKDEYYKFDKRYNLFGITYIIHIFNILHDKIITV